jgi:hypothetical protein
VNRKQRRRAAAQSRHQLIDYVQQLPEVASDALGQPGSCVHMVYYHDDGCSILNGGHDCNCRPTIKYHAEPLRS